MCARPDLCSVVLVAALQRALRDACGQLNRGARELFREIGLAFGQSKQPNDELGMNGQIGLPYRWWTRSQLACISHATPIQRCERSARYATPPASAVYASYQSPSPPLMYSPLAPATKMALKFLRAGSFSSDIKGTNASAPINGP
jgi:hypothetical protein